MERSKRRKRLESANAALNVIEELVWALSSRDGAASLREGISELRSMLQDDNSRDLLLEHVPKNPNSRLLIGILPQLLADQKLFPANQDIERFARQLFSISISRWEKRSRYEMIGMLVMQVHELPDSKLTSLVRALTSLLNRDEAIENLRRDVSRVGFSWNEAIRQLASR